ncbi:ABC transporter substrate-binding protein [Labedella endophytica]|jgi:polar amino acid transport system substrate-binding protein|uniref:ABC transporter substrate-binding protein n=1 Tax=Labedella endophytica TaxID=1523160 RepID=A0A3S0X991_9MICO|nr:ABC transporter substrate-binding protein [Labedella endophytica]RUQ99097.1 ABC transporter substrate-binding protein [Labedella endophytica]
MTVATPYARPRRSARPRLTLLAVSVGAIAAFTGCSTPSSAPDSGTSADPVETIGSDFIAGTFDQEAADLLPSDIAEAGVIHAAGGPGYAPHFLLADDGETLTGNDIELLLAVGDVLGVEVEHEDVGFDAMIPSLQSERVDMANGAMSVTDERLAVVDYVTYFAGGTSLIVPTGNPLGIDLDSMCGRRIAVQQGTVYADNYMPIFDAECTAAGEEPIEISVFPTQPDATLALTSGRADASMSDYGPLVYVADRSSGALEVLEETYDPSTWGFTFTQGSDLSPAIAAAVNVLIEDGTYAEILSKWGVTSGAVEESEVLTSAGE